MRIVIDIRSTLKKKTGIGYYTINLINSLAKLDNQNKFYLYSKIKLFNPKKKLPTLPSRNFIHLVNRWGINPQKILKDFDIIHTSNYDIPKPKNTKLVLVVHDVIHKIYPQYHTEDAVRSVETNLIQRLKEVDFLIVDSQTTKEDFLRFYSFPQEKIKVIYPGVEDYRLISVPDNFYKRLKELEITFPYILSVGTLEPRKNIKGLLKAYRILKDKYSISHRLVITGMKGWMYEDIFNFYKEMNLNREVIFTDYLPREELLYLYKLADIFAYPSFYEGAGLPVLEAFSCGVPVVTSNRSAMREIAENFALLIDPYKPEEIAEAIYKIISNQKLKEELIQKGFVRAKEFCWERTAQETLKVFRELS